MKYNKKAQDIKAFSCVYDNRFCPDNRLTLVFTLTAFCLLGLPVLIVSNTSFSVLLLPKA